MFPASSGALYLMPAGESHRLVRDPDPADRAIIAHIAGASTTVDELERVLSEQGLTVTKEAIAEKLDALLRSGLARYESPAVHELDPLDRERFDRQLPYFAEWTEAADAQAALRGARVVVLGCGAMGTWVLGALASAGVGRFVLVDGDRVERTNLNRQILYTEDRVGDLKVEAAADWVRRFDPAIDVDPLPRFVSGADDVAAVIGDASVLVQAADQPAYDVARWANAACVEHRVPMITAGQYPPALKIGPTYVPGTTACFDCHERALRRDYPLYEELSAHRQLQAPSWTTLGPAAGWMGSVVALEIVHLLTGMRPLATEGRTLLLDMRTLESKWEPVERDPSCPRCRHLTPGA